MQNYYEQKKERRRISDEFSDYVKTRFTTEQGIQIDDIAYEIAKQVLTAVEQQTGSSDAHMSRVLHYACERYISGYEGNFDELMKQFDFFKLDVTGDRKDMLREALEVASPYREKFQAVIDTPISGEQTIKDAWSKRSSESGESDSEPIERFLEPASPGSTNYETTDNSQASTMLNRWQSDEAKKNDQVRQASVLQGQVVQRTVRDRWEEAVEKAKKAKEEKSLDLER